MQERGVGCFQRGDNDQRNLRNNGLAVLIVLAVVATVWVLLTVRSSRAEESLTVPPN